jgi:hypothetical protein
VEWSIVAAPGGIRTYADLASTYSSYADMPVGTLYADLGTFAGVAAALNKQRLAVVAADGAINIVGTAESGGAEVSTFPPSAGIPISRLYLGRFKVARQQGTSFKYLRCNKMLQGIAVLHGHDYNGVIIRSNSSLVHDRKHHGMYHGTCEADTLSVEFRGVFVLTECIINAANGGTHQQYAAPAKKYERLLFSEVYDIPSVVVPEFAITATLTSDTIDGNYMEAGGLLYPNVEIELYFSAEFGIEASVGQTQKPLGVDAALGWEGENPLVFNRVGETRSYGHVFLAASAGEGVGIAGYAYASVVIATGTFSPLYPAGHPQTILSSWNAVIVPYFVVQRAVTVWEAKCVLDGYFDSLPANTTVIPIYFVSSPSLVTTVTVLETVTFDITSLDIYETGMSVHWLKSGMLYRPELEMLYVCVPIGDALNRIVAWVRIQIDSTQTVVGAETFVVENPLNIATRFSAATGITLNNSDILYGHYQYQNDVSLLTSHISEGGVALRDYQAGGTTFTYSTYSGRTTNATPVRVLDVLVGESTPVVVDVIPLIVETITSQGVAVPESLYIGEASLRIY